MDVRLDPPDRTPLVTAVGMGYGHLRAARALADHLGTDVVRGDREPLASPSEARLWRLTRRLYEGFTRLSQTRAGTPLRTLLQTVTEIPPAARAARPVPPTLGARLLAAMVRRGLGKGLADAARASGRTVLTTFYAQAIAAAAHGAGSVACVVTDTDVNRIWAPVDAGATTLRYLAPGRRAADRLTSYGVPPSRIDVTGFPLPDLLVGGTGADAARRNLAARLVRLDPGGTFVGARLRELSRELGPLPADERGRPPLLTLAVGGAGAQAAVARKLVAGLADSLRRGRIRLALVAGLRTSVAEGFRTSLCEAGLTELPGGPVEVLHDTDFDAYYWRFNALLARTDVLWTKPSEMSFYAALGLPLVLAPAVGQHEAANRRWLLDRGAGLVQRQPARAAAWLEEWLVEGVLAAAAWAGFQTMPREGAARIVAAVGSLVEAGRSTPF